MASERNLIVSASLSCPPSEVYAFRSLTLFASAFCSYAILVKVPWEDRDAFWGWMKQHYLLDYIEDFIAEEEIEPGLGKQLDVDIITCNNLLPVLCSIGFNPKKLAARVAEDDWLQ